MMIGPIHCSLVEVCTDSTMVLLQCEQGYKLLDIKTTPQMPHRSKQFSTHTWSGILKHLHQVQCVSSSSV